MLQGRDYCDQQSFKGHLIRPSSRLQHNQRLPRLVQTEIGKGGNPDLCVGDSRPQCQRMWSATCGYRSIPSTIESCQITKTKGAQIGLQRESGSGNKSGPPLLDSLCLEWTLSRANRCRTREARIARFAWSLCTTYSNQLCL